MIDRGDKVAKKFGASVIAYILGSLALGSANGFADLDPRMPVGTTNVADARRARRRIVVLLLVLRVVVVVPRRARARGTALTFR